MVPIETTYISLSIETHGSTIQFHPFLPFLSVETHGDVGYIPPFHGRAGRSGAQAEVAAPADAIQRGAMEKQQWPFCTG